MCGLEVVDTQLDNMGDRITHLYSKMCWELGADLQVDTLFEKDFAKREKKIIKFGKRCHPCKYNLKGHIP